MKIIAFIVLVSHINFSMFIAQIDEVDVFDKNGQQREDVNSLIEYLANTDREQMVTGTPEYDGVKLRQIDPFTSEALLTHGGATFGVATRIISRNGRSMTITFRRPDADVLNVAVYRKQ